MTRTPVRDERGQILILTVLSMTVLLGVAALSIDASFMYDTRNRLAAAADASARTVAAELQRQGALPQADAYTFAAQQVTAHGFTPGPCNTLATNIAAICLDFPPMDGPFTGVPGYVEARVSQTTPTFFGYVLGFVNAKPGGRAVAGPSNNAGCLVTLAAGNPGITANSAGGFISAPVCDVVDGGNLDGANITARRIVVSGGSVSCGGCSAITPNAAAPTDPLAGLQTPDALACMGSPPGLDVTVNGSPGAPTLLNPGTYHDITFSGYLRLAPGMYCITGAMHELATGSVVNISATGPVTIYLNPTAQLSLNADTIDINLQGPLTGPYRRVVFFQDRMNTTLALLARSIGTWTIEGALYFPAATVQTKNVTFAASNQCGLIVAGALEVDAPNLTLDNRCGGLNGSPIQTISMAE